jgi:ABC-type glycerol-3-phosphate transport system permease component
MTAQQKIDRTAHRVKMIRSLFPHIMLWIGIAIIIFPIYFIFSASSHTSAEIQAAPMPLNIGSHLIENYRQALFKGTQNMGTPVLIMMKNSLIMALGISVGKIAVSLLAAFAIVFSSFRFGISASGVSSSRSCCRSRCVSCRPTRLFPTSAC